MALERVYPGRMPVAGSMRAAIGAVTTSCLVAAVAMTPAQPASAAPLAWNGRYQMTTYASQKVGTSLAARQPEADFGAVFTLSTACSLTRCVATVVDGPAPGNPSIPQPTRFAWNGTDWTTTYDWLWDCLTTPGAPKQWARATSFTSYTPQPDGSLRGTWHTDISEGTCRGSVVMPVVATPA